MPSPQPEGADHYFTARPGARSRPREVDLVLPEGRLLTLATDRGVFSPDRIDAGTRALIAEGPPVVEQGVVADVGCGYGPVAITLALRSPAVRVLAVDTNERALELCRANAERHGVADRVDVVHADHVPEVVIDQLWSNPPIRVGKPALHQLLTTWLGRLRPVTGSAALVVHKHLGSDSLARWLTERGWTVDRLASRGGYRVLSVHPAPSTSDAP